jgi:ATP/maltotriose-dependent transcriptional regulator MalT
LADAGARGSSRGVAFASCYRGWTRYRRGDLLGAEADLDAFMQLAVEYSLEMLQPLTVGSLIAVLVERGDHDAAARQLHAFETSNSDVDSVMMQELRAGSALLDLALGNPAAALDTALTIGAWEHRYGLEHDAFTSWRRLAARSHAALGDREQAVRVAAEAVDRARDFGARDYLGVALHVAATVGEQDGVCEGLADAIAVLEHSQARLEYARALIDLGAAHRRQGRRAAARDPLRTGLDLARECAASPLADRAAVELRAAGARPRDVVRSGLDALTASERRVAQLASEGLTNAQIAQALFVTTKTVETHLGHVYQKLDIRSRHQLPRI